MRRKESELVVRRRAVVVERRAVEKSLSMPMVAVSESETLIWLAITYIIFPAIHHGLRAYARTDRSGRRKTPQTSGKETSERKTVQTKCPDSPSLPLETMDTTQAGGPVSHPDGQGHDMERPYLHPHAFVCNSLKLCPCSYSLSVSFVRRVNMHLYDQVLMNHRFRALPNQWQSP